LLLAKLRAIREREARFPELDQRSDAEIIGFDDNGIWDRLLIVIDTSAIAANPFRLVPATCVLEASMALVSRHGEHALAEIDLSLATINASMPRSLPSTPISRISPLKPGLPEGRHPAALNFADCLSDALATLCTNRPQGRSQRGPAPVTRPGSRPTECHPGRPDFSNQRAAFSFHDLAGIRAKEGVEIEQEALATPSNPAAAGANPAQPPPPRLRRNVRHRHCTHHAPPLSEKRPRLQTDVKRVSIVSLAPINPRITSS